MKQMMERAFSLDSDQLAFLLAQGGATALYGPEKLGAEMDRAQSVYAFYQLFQRGLIDIKESNLSLDQDLRSCLKTMSEAVCVIETRSFSDDMPAVFGYFDGERVVAVEPFAYDDNNFRLSQSSIAGFVDKLYAAGMLPQEETEKQLAVETLEVARHLARLQIINPCDASVYAAIEIDDLLAAYCMNISAAEVVERKHYAVIELAIELENILRRVSHGHS